MSTTTHEAGPAEHAAHGSAVHGIHSRLQRFTATLCGTLKRAEGHADAVIRAVVANQCLSGLTNGVLNAGDVAQ